MPFCGYTETGISTRMRCLRWGCRVIWRGFFSLFLLVLQIVRFRLRKRRWRFVRSILTSPREIFRDLSRNIHNRPVSLKQKPRELITLILLHRGLLHHFFYISHRTIMFPVVFWL